MKLLLVGATGLVGRHVLDLALADPRVSAVIAPGRRSLPEQTGLLSPLVDYERLPEDAEWWKADAIICTLGTTMKVAGSEAAFRRVDHDYPLSVARLARGYETPVYVLNSAIGANVKSRFFYNRVKGELEQDLTREGFTSLTFVRPGVIGGQREESRPGESIMVRALAFAGPLLPRRWRLNPPEQIARVLLEAALNAKAGVHVVTSERMV
ncbi:NAD-dependent dehydratase [Pectobacterium odoriferum]|uniref:NAD-dependent dehydratase n=1 Tax=Pectobacterium odoriferum TaxID=78398 RepID=UPI000CD04FA0|nr:NAD-dependent dehydratase [Pectobacterium odoriferum]POE03415.1 NAD-dependent dehydratase [Pectobacterium odoriferum]POE09439.1 NAD-dependent dehydratase [Pectobacterium odoriferum]